MSAAAGNRTSFWELFHFLAGGRRGFGQFIPTSEVETADNADDADKQELGGETGRMSPKHAF